LRYRYAKKTGWEFVSEIRGGAVPGKEDIPIIMLTGLDTDYAMAGDQHRVDGFISKPPTADRLRDNMIRVMGFGPQS
jgi:CheY-like chemotaxis protein